MRPSALTRRVRVISHFCCNKSTFHYSCGGSGKLFLAQEGFGVLFIRHLQKDFHEELQVRKNENYRLDGGGSKGWGGTGKVIGRRGKVQERCDS